MGFTEEERAHSPYARFYDERIAPLAEHVREALAVGAIAPELLPPVEAVPTLQHDGYWPVETGYTQGPDGSVRVFDLTQMPGVTPAMWDWWFAWHGSETQRYKLWHPRAHVHVAWADGRGALDHYVGRTSNVVEYLGSRLLKFSIRFVAPSELGLDEQALKARGEIAICARCSLTGVPVETAWMVHHVRPVEGGAEMRSRFWTLGANVIPGWMRGPAGLVARFKAAPPADLLVHCAQEMSHLAARLPAIYDAFGKS